MAVKKIFKYFKVMTKLEYSEYEDLILYGKPDTYLTKSKIDEFEKRLIPIVARDKLLKDIATRNNKGIDLEKRGNIKKAIEMYEKNIENDYRASHSFDRLLIIYRKEKKYDDELRVILRWLSVFKETDEEFEIILNNPKNEIYKEKLMLAREANIGLKNHEGWYIYNPYNHTKYINRLEKVKKLLEKVTR